MPATAGDDRKRELADALADVRGRIEAAARAAGRDPGEITLVAVTKTFPATDAAQLVQLGVADLGENRDQEAGPKAAELAAWGVARPRWHMVGRLQRNKARSVVRWADVVQSVDSARLADALDTAVARAREDGQRDGPLDVLLQASIDDDPGRGGCPLADLPALADHVAGRAELRLRGVMAVAPLGVEPERAFAALQRASVTLRAQHALASEISAGMTGDLEVAIGQGSTCVRVGTALLGGRELTSP
ncbi:MAG TPA: YggS family pyridoxal phosphate-dependent enzyme [Pseudonocardiaceae bacterium]